MSEARRADISVGRNGISEWEARRADISVGRTVIFSGYEFRRDSINNKKEAALSDSLLIKMKTLTN